MCQYRLTAQTHQGTTIGKLESAMRAVEISVDDATYGYVQTADNTGRTGEREGRNLERNRS